MDITLLQNIFQSITLSKPAPREMLLKDKENTFRRILSIPESINKARKHILNEVADQVLSNMYWKEVNIVEIEPKDFSYSSLLLKNLIGQVDPLVFAIISTDEKQLNAAKTYIQNHIKNPLIVTGFFIQSNEEDFSGYINELRNKYHAHNLFFISANRSHELLLLKKLYAIASRKDYILIMLPTCSQLFVEKLKRKMKHLMEKNVFPEAWRNLLLSPEDGAWRFEYKDPYFEVKFKLRRKVQLKFYSEAFNLARNQEICLLRIYMPQEDYLFPIIVESGYTIIYSCKEERSSISLLICQKGSRIEGQQSKIKSRESTHKA